MIAALSGPAELKQFDRYALLKKWTSVDQQFQAHVAGIYTNPSKKNLKIHKKVKTFKTFKNLLKVMMNLR